MPPAVRRSSAASTVARLVRAGRAFGLAIVVAAAMLVGYDLWVWISSAHALERLTGLRVDALVRVRIRPAALARTMAPGARRFLQGQLR